MEDILLPRIELGTQPSGVTVRYEMLPAQVPYLVFRDHSADVLDEARSRDWVEWLRATEAERAHYFVGFLASAGAPVAGVLDSRSALTALAAWARLWLPRVFEERYNVAFVDIVSLEKSSNALPRSVTAEAEALFQSLVHDITFVTVATARMVRPDLVWRLQQLEVFPWLASGGSFRRAMPGIKYLPTLWEEPPWVDPVREVSHFVNNAALGTTEGPPVALGSGDWLNRLARRLGGDVAPGGPGFIEVTPYPPGELAASLAVLAQLERAATTPLRAPRQSAPPARPDIVMAAAVFRRAGFFARLQHLSDEDLGRAVSTTWRKRQWDELAEDPERLDEELLVLDSERTWYDDPEADVSPGNEVYRSFLRELAKCSGGAMKVTNVKEDWESQPGSVVLSFRLNGERHHLVLDDMDDWINPFAVTGLNDLLPPDNPHFYFVDNGGQMAIVTRATEKERQALEAARPIRLLTEPPDWWMAVQGAGLT